MNPSEPYPDSQRLVDEYFLRDLTRQEIDELNAALVMNPALKAEFIKSMHDDLDLYEAMQHMQEEKSLRETTVRFSKRKSAVAVRMNRINKIAAALIILLSIGGGIYHKMNPSPAPVVAEHREVGIPQEAVVSAPVIERPAGNPVPETADPIPAVLKKELRMIAKVTDLFLLEENGIAARNEVENRLLSIGDHIGVGDVLSIPSGGRLSLKYLSEATTVSFEENSSFKILESDGAKLLELHDGRMVAEVDKQQEGKPFRIITDDAELVVLGTRFELMNRKETILSVFSGNVQMNDLSDDDTVSVPAGYFAASDRGEFSRPTAFHHKKLKPVNSRTLPGIPRNHKKAGDQFILVDPNRKIKGRVDFDIPRIKGRISSATLRLRVMAFETDHAGGGTIRVKRDDQRDARDLGVHTGRVKAGMDVIFSIDPMQLSTGTNRLLLELDNGGNDFWFGSEESSHPPELDLTIIDD